MSAWERAEQQSLVGAAGFGGVTAGLHAISPATGMLQMEKQEWVLEEITREPNLAGFANSGDCGVTGFPLVVGKISWGVKGEWGYYDGVTWTAPFCQDDEMSLVRIDKLCQGFKLHGLLREANVDSNIEIVNDVQCEASISEHGVNEENSDDSVRAKEVNADDGFNDQDVPCEEVNICQSGGDHAMNAREGVNVEEVNPNSNNQKQNQKGMPKATEERMRNEGFGASLRVNWEDKDDYSICISMTKAWRAKDHALKRIHGDEATQYGRLHDYKCEILRTNPGSTMTFREEKGEFGNVHCLSTLKEAFKDGCRKLICLDGCWLKGTYGGQLFSAVGIDPNDCMFPLAYAIMRMENKNSWQ
ncbi:hypothetical protein GH714_009613 [Hevea brasiliensis]|uniref:MULE transposase domain-containing protein n=1 Tax=Hevea brasiliensis TaxID=3981 RepID=A0A6A6NCX4_HEVBR|nr:hypothetical protein GH714_009613 [Hevea brasiliensis]